MLPKTQLASTRRITGVPGFPFIASPASPADEEDGNSGGGGGGKRVVVITNQQNEVSAVKTFSESYFAENPLKRMQVNDVGFIDADGNSIYEARVGQQVSIASTFSNHQQKPQDYSFIVMVVDDDDGFTIDIAWQEGTARSGQTVELSSSWMPEDGSMYTVKVFIWDGFVNPLPLTDATAKNMSVV